ncbi:hypothetical protein [Burkholderia glumae]|uniref:hypothetical protein n=1 Tax=Burkholderia glumae TaxID=337 RepID=UPI000F5F32BC|nr:hypothetical protein [Burkholderia glumae]MCQ0030849.1 hypothetical protein [Burkholderia glumae]MCQ0036511.1 hypothetical protein [Burkholderia glumae]QJW77847.1 hypothetical protein GAS18_03150 [Burkholderia glumae]
MQLIVDEAESGVDRPFMAKRGWPPPGDAIGADRPVPATQRSRKQPVVVYAKIALDSDTP